MKGVRDTGGSLLEMKDAVEVMCISKASTSLDSCTWREPRHAIHVPPLSTIAFRPRVSTPNQAAGYGASSMQLFDSKIMDLAWTLSEAFL